MIGIISGIHFSLQSFSPPFGQPAGIPQSLGIAGPNMKDFKNSETSFELTGIIISAYNKEFNAMNIIQIGRHGKCQSVFYYGTYKIYL